MNVSKKHNDWANTAMKGIYGSSNNNDNLRHPVSDLFYSRDNMKRIQKLIKKTIYERTKGAFKLEEDQDESDLMVAMNAVFLENSKFLPYKFKTQVKELNRRTIEYVIPDMIVAIKQSYRYIKEINSPLQFLPRPMNVNNAGRKTLPALTSAWNL